MKLIISNHKMNLTKGEVEQYVKDLEEIESDKNRLVFCPSFPYIPYFTGKNYKLGSQNVAERTMGALTGEVSIEQLKSLGVEYSIVGHSERRNLLKEENETIRKKVVLCLENGIYPILCIGEKEEELHCKEQVLKEEIDSVFENLEYAENVIIAYEPIWAIGTGKTPTNSEIDNSITWIKQYIKDRYRVDCPVLYGGSVNEKNIDTLSEIEVLDGYLIGGTSLKVSLLNQIIKKLEG